VTNERQLQYHQRTFDVLGLDVPPVSEENAMAVAEFEATIQRRLPASLREWYSLSGACKLLRKYEIIDEPAQLDVPGRPFSPGLLRLTPDGFLYLGCTEQGVCGYAIALGGPNDPPVLVHCDRPGEVWHREHDSFSGFVADMAAQCKRPRRDDEC
jgi:hypothetical protein